MAKMTYTNFLSALAAAAALSSCAATTGSTQEQARALTPLQAELVAATDEIASVMRANHYNPKSLSTPAYRAMEVRAKALALSSASKEAFVDGFNTLWEDGPFSHVNLTIAKANAEDTARFLDGMRVGKGAELAWSNDVAILTVYTMMGTDTIEQIDAAFAEITEKGARALIVDLRPNEGGAFAVRPLVGHVIAEPLDAGAFVSQKWAAQRRRAPQKRDIAGLVPSDSWSIIEFWRNVQETPITRIQFGPVAPVYDGPVFVLTSSRTASAAEMATDALAANGRAILIGENTAGQMLSQKPFDLGGGLQLYLPIADYYAWRSGHIEGNGVAPDVAVTADKAMEAAFARIAK